MLLTGITTSCRPQGGTNQSAPQPTVVPSPPMQVQEPLLIHGSLNPSVLRLQAHTHSSPTMALRRAELKSGFIDGVRRRRASSSRRARDIGSRLDCPPPPACLTLQCEVSWALLCSPKIISHFPLLPSLFQGLLFLAFRGRPRAEGNSFPGGAKYPQLQSLGPLTRVHKMGKDSSNGQSST